MGALSAADRDAGVRAAVAPRCPAAKAINPSHFGSIGAWWGGMILPFLPFRPNAFIWHQVCLSTHPPPCIPLSLPPLYV